MKHDRQRPHGIILCIILCISSLHKPSSVNIVLTHNLWQEFICVSQKTGHKHCVWLQVVVAQGFRGKRRKGKPQSRKQWKGKRIELSKVCEEERTTKVTDDRSIFSEKVYVQIHFNNIPGELCLCSSIIYYYFKRTPFLRFYHQFLSLSDFRKQMHLSNFTC